VIYGKPDCARCELAKAILHGLAEYREHGALYDDYDSETAVEIATATNGELPIIVIETPLGRLALGLGSGGHESGCEGGACRIDLGGTK
jgi:hypothetical protein